MLVLINYENKLFAKDMDKDKQQNRRGRITIEEEKEFLADDNGEEVEQRTKYQRDNYIIIFLRQLSRIDKSQDANDNHIAGNRKI